LPQTSRSHRLSVHPSTILLRLSVGLSAVAGVGVGIVLLWATAGSRAADLPFVALAQAHGQVQTIGFIGLFVLGTAAQRLPGFLTIPLTHPERLTLSGYAIAGGLLLRIVFQPMDTSLVRVFALSSSGLAETTGIALGLYTLLSLASRTIQPVEPWRRVIAVSFGFLSASVVLNLIAYLNLILGARVVPEPLDAALVHAELFGFAVTAVLAVSMKLLPRFLLLRPTDYRCVHGGVLLHALGAALVVIGWLVNTVGADPSTGSILRTNGMGLATVGVIAFAFGLRIYDHASRPSTAPMTTEPARLWIRLAFGWLIVGTLIGLWITIAETFGTGTIGYTQIAASRHALGQGFLLTVIVGLGSRILPGFAAWALVHPRQMSAIVATLTAGAAFRVAGELAGPAFGGPALVVAAIGGTLGTLGFFFFAFRLLQNLGLSGNRRRETAKPVKT
jgi:hypothetical protein